VCRIATVCSAAARWLDDPTTFAARRPEEHALSGQYLLLIDPNPATRRGMTDMLAPAGYRTVTLESLTDAVTALRQVRPAAVLIDIDDASPASDGLALLAQQQSIPVIVTGDLETALPWARRHGAAFVAQPAGIRTLQTVIERAITAQPPRPAVITQHRN
jgi:DNA-binding NtrC family response regulator